MMLNCKQTKLLVGCMLSMAILLLESCTQTAKNDPDKMCGNWVSVKGKPDVLIFKEGEQYKVTVFRRVGMTKRVKPKTYLLVEENGNLFINTGYRIDVAYNEATDVLTFSPNGDYTRVKEK